MLKSCHNSGFHLNFLVGDFFENIFEHDCSYFKKNYVGLCLTNNCLENWNKNIQKVENLKFKFFTAPPNYYWKKSSGLWNFPPSLICQIRKWNFSFLTKVNLILIYKSFIFLLGNLIKQNTLILWNIFFSLTLIWFIVIITWSQKLTS